MALFDANNSLSSSDTTNPCNGTRVRFTSPTVHTYFVHQSQQQPSEEPDDQAEDQPENNVYLSVCYAGGMLGASYYDQDTGEIYMMQDVCDNVNDLVHLQPLLDQVCPTHVIACYRQDKRFIDELKNKCISASNIDELVQAGEEAEEEEEECEMDDVAAANSDGIAKAIEETEVTDPENKPMLFLMKNVFFNVLYAKQRLELLLTEEGASDQQRHMQLAFSVNLDCPCMIRATGALLLFLEENRIGVELEDYTARTPIFSIKQFTIEQMMEVDLNTKLALQVFCFTVHPSVFKAGKQSGIKEGNSLYNVCDKCSSCCGRAELRRWWEHPRWSKEELEGRMSAIKYLSSSPQLINSLRRELKNLKNPNLIFKRMQLGTNKATDWISLTKTIQCLVQIASVLSPKSQNVSYLSNLCSQFDEDLTRMLTLLTQLIDFTETRNENRFVVRLGVDEKLDERKAEYNRLPAILSKLADQQSEEFRFLVSSSCGTEYLPILGFFMTAVEEAGTREEDWERAIPGAKFAFSARGRLYYKTDTMKAMDEKMGDVKMNIVDEETSCMLRLQAILVQYAAVTITALRAAANIDALCALSLTCSEQDWSSVTWMEDQPRIHIREGRHPLVEKVCLGKYVTNDFVSNCDQGKVCVITAPNASGKSVYLKQAGVLVYMSQVSGHVSANGAYMTPVDRLFSRLHSFDTLIDGLSTFAKDLQQMSLALRRATANSLVIIDEFGKGTVTKVGLSLLCACVELWVERGDIGCPHVLISTHMHSLISMLPKSPLVVVKTLEVVQKGNDLVYLHQLVDGTIDMSCALHTALRVGIEENIAARALQVINCLKDFEPIPPTHSRAENEMQRFNAAAEHFIVWDEFDATGFLGFYEQLLSLPPSTPTTPQITPQREKPINFLEMENDGKDCRSVSPARIQTIPRDILKTLTNSM